MKAHKEIKDQSIKSANAKSGFASTSMGNAKIQAYARLLYKYLRPQRWQVVLLSILLFTSVGLQLVNPQIIRFFIDMATAGRPVRVLIVAAGLYFGVALVQQALTIGVTYMSQRVGWISTNELRTDLAAHCLKLDMTFHKEHRPGEIIERIDGDVTTMFELFSKLLVEIASTLTLGLGVLVLLYLEDWRIGLGMTALVCLAALTIKKINGFAVPRQTAIREIITDFFGFLGEVLGSTEDIRSNGAEGKILWRLREYFRAWLPRRWRSTMVYFAMWFSTLGLFAIADVVVLGIGGYLWSRGTVTLGTVYLIFCYTDMLRFPFRAIQRQLGDLQKAIASIQRVEELFRQESRISDGQGNKLPEGALALQINCVNFEYEVGVPVLRNLSLRLKPGTILGVLGRTGSGKTTLARLLTRFYDPSSGEIKLNGQPITTLSLADLRRRIGFVTQDVQLFNASVRDNLTFFNSDIPDTQIWAALEEIGLTDWVRALPEGLETMLASDGGGISAGEAQLLAFVRIFLKDPGLIILDEASSRLDPLTEQLMEKAIDKLFQNRTGIIIAHRLQTIERAQAILILDNGEILEYGNRRAMVRDSQSHFSKLLQKGIEEVLA